ncbi:hypothetical protein GCM10022225_75550 [Plantactinospora mayteni]|uniref:Uncharacterized protein n=1 Tax=Plantactinospora mayteni TaxID=566021 RepID=A0ABQ4F215_9ACTN|nr:hypothetical protein [Plantactinospora mayteni]GIH00950.1 hypothetical protein Pma05_75220 [Plantactinospora mayteni]
MGSDERIGLILTELTEDLRPQPDPYGRVLARHRRGRRRALTATLCAVALLATVGIVVTTLRPGGGAAPEPAASQSAGARMLAWADRLARSEPRGRIGTDQGYRTSLAETLLADARAGRLPRLTTPVREVRVLFVDDVGPHRVAFAAFVFTGPDSRGWPNAMAWMVADQGAGPQELARTAAERFGDGLEPYESLTLGSLDEPDQVGYVGIAPEGCDFATAGMPAPQNWTPEPTGSYLVRPPGSLRPEWFQVSCAGEVRKRLPGPGSWAPEGVTEDQFAAAVSQVRGRLHPTESRAAMSTATGGWGYTVTELPTVVWSGETTGTGIGFDGLATVVSAPAVDGGWLGEVAITYRQEHADETIGTGSQFATRTDPAAPDRLLAIPLGPDDGASGPPDRTLLVIAPTGATEVRALLGDRAVAQGQVENSALVLRVPSTENLRLQALDGTGAVLGTERVVESFGPGYQLDAWDAD